jgi:hypothetical protein
MLRIVPAILSILLSIALVEKSFSADTEAVGYLKPGLLVDEKTNITRLEFGVWSIDGEIVPHWISGVFRKPEFSDPLAMSPGMRNINIARRRMLFNDKKVGTYNLNPIPLRVHIEAGRHYLIEGELLFGNIARYWVENAESGERVSNVRYTPQELEDVIAVFHSGVRESRAQADLNTVGKRFFANKSTLRAGKDCFTLFEEVQTNAREQASSAVLEFLSCFGGACIGSKAPAEYGYRVYDERCMDVMAGHKYEIVGEFLGGSSFSYQIWDRTEGIQLAEFGSADLHVKMLMR